MSPLNKGYSISILGLAIWSTTPIFIGHLIQYYEMSALVLSFWRNIAVSMLLFAILQMSKQNLNKIKRDQIKFFIYYGLILAVFNSAWTLSIAYNGAAVATVLGYSSAGFTAILAWQIFDEKLGLHKILAVVFSLAGCVLVTKAHRPDVWQLNPLGILTGILSGVLFSGYNLMGKKASQKKINPWTSLLYSFAFGSVFILFFNLFSILPSAAGSIENMIPDLPFSGWFVLMILAIPTILGFGLYITSMDYLPVSIASLMTTLGPVMSATQAYILLGERMTTAQIFGSLIILFAVIIVQFER